MKQNARGSGTTCTRKFQGTGPVAPSAQRPAERQACTAVGSFGTAVHATEV